MIVCRKRVFRADVRKREEDDGPQFDGGGVLHVSVMGYIFMLVSKRYLQNDW